MQKKDTEILSDMNELKKFEIFPDRKIQEKIDRYMSPYNKAYNFRNFMNFDEANTNDFDECSELEPSNIKWNKISDLILHKSRWFLRKSLKCINKQLYKNWEEISKSFKIKPRRSHWK